MFAAFTDKLKRTLEVKLSNEELVASGNDSVNVSAATILAALNISDRVKNKVTHDIIESLGLRFGSIAYYTKDVQPVDATNDIKPRANTDVEDKTARNVPSDDDLISSGPKNMIWRSVYVG